MNDFTENDCLDFMVGDNAYNLDKNWPKRNNADYSFKKLGGETLRSCYGIGNKMRILNGTVTGDLDGKLIVSEDLQSTVLEFQVQALTPYSDHWPITLKLASRNHGIMYSNNTPKETPRTEASSRNRFTKFLWKPEFKDKFISTMSSFHIQKKLKSLSAEHHSLIDDEISCTVQSNTKISSRT